MRYLGIDYGLRYVGLALGDDETHMAMPYKTIDQTHEHIFDALKKIILDEHVEALVVGMPFSQGASREQEKIGSKASVSRSESVPDPIFQAFIKQLKSEVTMPIHEQNEQFTSQEAAKRLREGGGGDDHSVAAMLILQGYLDYTLTTNH
ncbi:pre-16S rRNA-processing nuclease YqgF [Candidatus Uhrbacteria bacterium]|nr:pre-16S rRNA-processing nuclease YqgF [Candidatus Uhrbacteria bacterium]